MASSTPLGIKATASWLPFALAAGLFIAAPAHAKDAAELAREQFRIGQKAYENRDFEQALKAFSEAYGLEPAPGLLFNIAQCHRELGNYERAAVFYQQYLDLSMTKVNDATVRVLLSEVQAKEGERRRPLAEEEAARKKELKLAAAQRDSNRDLGLKSAVAREPSKTNQAAAPAVSDNSVFKKWWFWTGIGIVVAGTTAYLIASQHQSASLGTVNSR